MEPTKQEGKPSDEIDLSQFFRWIGNGLSRMGKSILYGLASLRNSFFSNKLFFAGIIIFGLVLGGVYSALLKKEYYKTSMVLSCDYLNTQILENTINKLNLLCQEKAREGLVEELAIDLALAKNIQRFEYRSFVSEDDVVEMEVLKTQLNSVAPDKKEVVDKVLEKLKIDNKNAYEISAYIYNPDVIRSLEKKLVNYFFSDPYIKRRVEINKTNLTKRKNKLISEGNKLDSLKAVLYKNYDQLSKTSRGSGNVILGDEKLSNPIDIYREDLNLYRQLEEVEEDLYIQPDFEVVEGFTTFKQPESDSLAKTLFIAFWVSILMGYLIIGAWKFDRLLASYDRRP
jgi:hypothetical protein